MVKYFVFIFGLLLFVGAPNIVAAADNDCGGLKCTSRDYQIADGPIGSTANTPTVIGSCRVLCVSSGVICVWALREYASVATGAFFRDHRFSIPQTYPTTVEIHTTSPVGFYADNLTGTTHSSCGIRK